MKHISRIIAYASGILIAMLLGFGIVISSAHAEADFMVGWQTKTSAPAWFKGRGFPTYQSFITVGFELIENGKVVDLSKTAVRWYVDGKLLKNESDGLGIRQVTVFNKKYGGEVVEMKIVIPDYRGRELLKLFAIPIKTPEVVVDIPYIGKKVARGENTLYAWPFFFGTTSVKKLNLQWTVDGNALQASSAADAQLLFSTGSESREGAKSTIEATVINPEKTIERIVKKVFVNLP